MPSPANTLKLLILISAFFVLSTQNSRSQEKGAYFKFQIHQSGVYKVTAQQIQRLGFNSLEEVAIFGYPGMLPQVLDSLAIRMEEIPVQRLENALLFYAEAAHQVQIGTNRPNLAHHYYTDTLTYLIGPKYRGNDILPFNNSGAESLGQSQWTQFQFIKEVAYNALNSGRNWYSRPIFSGRPFALTFNRPGGALKNGKLHINLMGQSLTENNFDVAIGNQLLGRVNIPPIPNATFGIKGREQYQVFEVNPELATGSTTISYQTSDINGAGYLDYAIYEWSFPNTPLSDGIYYQLGEGSFTTNLNVNTWVIMAPNKVFQVESGQKIPYGAKIVVFRPETTTEIIQFSPVNISIRTQDQKAQLIIIAPRILASATQRLASHKQQLGITSEVVFLEQIYDGFGYGHADITAIRNFIAYRYYGGNVLKNVLFLGKGTFDYKGILGGRPNLVPTYSSRSSLNPLTTYSSDDYYGILEMGRGEWLETSAGDEPLSIGIGRIPAINLREANIAVNKIITYEQQEISDNFWKNRILLMADDGDNNIHLNDAENHADFLRQAHPEIVIEKLYLDMFPQIRSGSTQTSPEAKKALLDAVKEGLLVLNYIGHGNETTLTAERLFTVADLQNWPQTDYLPLFVTATCEFGRQDSPLIRSGAEELLFAERKGAIGLLATGRPVFSSLNFALNSAFMKEVFLKENAEINDLGTIYKRTKNNSSNGPFNRNFSLIGDPSLKLALPVLDAPVEQLKDVRLETETDTLRPGQVVKITGSIVDPLTGAGLNSLDGNFQLMLSGPPVDVSTLGDESASTTFIQEENLLFAGTGKISSGQWTTEVILPGSLPKKLNSGTIRLMAKLNNREEAIGIRRITLGGEELYEKTDKEGPVIKLNYEGQPPFASQNLPLTIQLEDESGINVYNPELGKNITLRLNNEKELVLNRLFTATENSFKKGKIHTLLTGLEEGINTVTIEAWDNVGNSSSYTEEIIVQGSRQIRILEHVAYPNPAKDFSRFKITHNRLGENLLLKLTIYSPMGNEIFENQKRYVEADFTMDDLEWIFFKDKTNYPAKGIYIYRLQLIMEIDGSTDYKSGKIIIQ
jgi:hypothetical protein